MIAWDALSDREKEHLIGRHVMEYTIYHYDKDVRERCYYMLMDSEGDPVNRQFFRGAGEQRTEAKAWDDCPQFTTDRNAFAAVEEALERRGKDVIDRYILELMKIIVARNELHSLWWNVHTAPLDIRCKAALRACGVEVG